MNMSGPTTDHNEIRNWAKSRQIVPVEMLPHIVDHEPSVLRLMTTTEAKTRIDLRCIAWEEFFVKFDMLGLTFVYDNGSSGYHEILQIDGQ